MKKTKELQEFQMSRRFTAAVYAIALVLSLSLCWGHFSIVSHAESAGKVTANGGANVRSSASATSRQVTSLAKDQAVSIISQVKASDGYIWYEVWVDADTKGYIRSDLVQITDGSTPPTSSLPPATSTTQPAGNDNLPPAEVSRVNPISATVKGGNGVRIRSNASVNSQIIDTVQNGTVLTVNGQADSLDRDGGKKWYQVNFNSNGSEISGFIREDFVTLSGELTPYTEPTTDPGTEEPDPDTTQEPPVQPNVTKDYDTFEQDGKWYVKTPSGAYEIEKLLEVNAYVDTLSDNEKSVKSQKVVIVILVLLLVAAAGAIGFLVYKIKDMMDSAYFNAVENETIRRRSAQTGQGSRATQTVGPDRKTAAQRPAGQRPAGAPQGQRPAGAPQGQRPAGAPQGQRPAGTPQGQRPAGAPQGQKPAGAPQGQKPASTQNQSAARPQPKNFMTEEDEFEFEFLNYEGEDKQ